jgi:hypothetical protein
LLGCLWSGVWFVKTVSQGRDNGYKVMGSFVKLYSFGLRDYNGTRVGFLNFFLSIIYRIKN